MLSLVQGGGDLSDAVPGRAQLQPPLARSVPVALRGPFGPGRGGGEQVQPALAQQRGHLPDGGGGVAEPVGGLGGGHLVQEIGAQRLVPALRRAGRGGEVLARLRASLLSWFINSSC